MGSKVAGRTFVHEWIFRTTTANEVHRFERIRDLLQRKLFREDTFLLFVER